MPLPDLLSVFNALPGANLLLAPDLRIVAASDDYLAATLTQRAIIVGQFIFDAFPDNPQTPEANAVSNVRASLAQVLATRQPHEMAPQHYDVPDRAQPGRFVERHWLPRHTPVLDDQGQVQFIIQSVQDITARRLAERQLRESQAGEQEARADAEQQRQRFYEVLMALPAQVATYHGPDHVYHFVNAAYRRYFPSQALPGRSLREVLPETEAQGVLAVMDRVYQTGEPSYLQELEVWLDFDGRGQPWQLFLNLLFHPLRDAQGRVDGLLDFSYDVTEQVRARRQMEQLNAELETRVQERTQALHRQQVQLEFILSQIPASIALLTGPDQRHTFFNDAYRDLSGGRAHAGLSIAEVYPEAAGQGFLDRLRHVYATGQPYRSADTLVELHDPASGQRRRYLDFLYQPLPDAQGQTASILVFVVDMTEKVFARQRTETLQAQLLAAAQRQAAERQAFHAVFEQSPALIALLRAPGHCYEYANPAYQALFPGRQLVGLDVAVAVPEMLHQGFVALLDRVYQSGETYFGAEVPFTVARPGEEPRTDYFNFTYQAYQENGQTAGISVFAYNVTEQVRARRRTEEAAAELRLLTAHAPAFLYRADPAGHITYTNDALLEWGGFDRAKLATLDETWAVVHPDDLAAMQAGFRAAIDAGLPWESPPYRFRRHDGQLRWMLSRSQPVFGPGGELTGYSGITVEIHEQMELQRQLQRTNVDLDNFIYTASHDLKAPIANIEGLLLALEQELPAAGCVGDVPVMLDMMQGAVERFKRTIAHLTDVSRLQKEHAQPHNQVPLAAVITEVRLDLAPLVDESQARIDVDVAACPAVIFSEKNLRSVVYNLLSNALKYRHPDRRPTVRIRCRPEDGYLVLEVEDNGLGLDLARGQGQLFGMFQRLHTHVEGTGIGLYMVKKMVENAGGRIQVESRLGQGSTFAVYFPC